MLGPPSLRRRLIVSYLAVVVVVIAAAFVTVQILVPQFFEQGVQQRLGPGSGSGDQQGPGQQQQGESPGRGGPQGTTTSTSTPPGSGATTTVTTTATTVTTSTQPGRTGSTQGPGEPPDEPGQGNGDGSGDGNDGSGAPGGNPDPGTGGGDGGNGDGQGAGEGRGTTTDAYIPLHSGLVAAPEFAAAQTERNPVPTEIREEYDRALTAALIVATVLGLLIAVGLSFVFTRRLLRTLNDVSQGAQLLAEGRYDTRVTQPKESELADLAASVNTLADSLHRTEQSRARLVSDLAHEIRNPLSTIEGYMEGLIDGVLPESRETYEAIAREAHRLKRLTRDLSTLSKAQEGAIEYVIEDMDLAAVATRVADALRPQYEINDVALVVELGEPLPTAGDHDRIAQALTNLIGNALTHTPPGGSVSLRGQATDQWCSVTITDTGPGIPADQMETIFERFTRLDRDLPGTGIGLNIARTLVRAHGGEVRATSPGPGQGSTFELSLPRY